MSETFAKKEGVEVISLSEEELYKQFLLYKNDFKILLENGIFESFNGSKKIHKSGYEIKLIETNLIRRI